MGGSSSALEFAKTASVFSKNRVGEKDPSWKQLFDCPVSPTDVFHVLTFDGLREVKKKFPENFAMLLFKCVKQIRIFASPETSGKLVPVAAKTALTILCRILPVVFEPDDVNLGSADDNNGTAAAAAASPTPSTAAGDGLSFADRVLWKNSTCVGNAKFDLPPDETLAEMLVHALLYAAFVPQFTITAAQTKPCGSNEAHALIEPHLLWAPGVGSLHSAPCGTSASDILANRLLVIKALTSCFTGDAYQPIFCAENKIRSLLTSTRTPHTSTLVASLINSICGYLPTGTLPYSSHIISDREEVVYRSAELLLLLLDFDVFYPGLGPKALQEKQPQSPLQHHHVDPAALSPTASGTTASTTGNSGDKPQQQPVKIVAPENIDVRSHAAWNVFRCMQAREMDNIVLGLSHLVNNRVLSKTALLPGSQRALPCGEEYFLLLWKLIDKCPDFRKFFSKHRMLDRYVVSLLDFAIESVEKPAKRSGLQLCIMFLFRLSVERDFAVKLNQPCTCKLPWTFNVLQNFTGTHADLVLLVLHYFLLQKKQWVVTVHPSCLSIIANIAPFMTTISTTAAVKLVNLFQQYSSPSWLELEPKFHPRMLQTLILIMAHLLQYQYSGSTSLLYALVRAQGHVRKFYTQLSERTLPIPDEVARNMHIMTLMCAIDAVHDEIMQNIEKDPNFAVQKYLQSITIVGKVPAPHPILYQPWISRPQTDGWLSSWLWSLLYIHAWPQFLDPQTVKLFEMRKAS